MFSRLCKRKRTVDDPLRDEISRSIDFDDPAQRTGATLFLILDKQIKLLGETSYEVPVKPQFASDKCRGAIMGTAIRVVTEQFTEPKPKDFQDGIMAAFAVVFGELVGPRLALQAIQDSSGGNAPINFASDWAIKDTEAHFNHGPSTPMAYYLAAMEMI